MSANNRIKRPWDKAFHRPLHCRDKQVPKPNYDNNIPSITIDGERFYSDRFYLNDPIGIDSATKSFLSTKTATSNACSSCMVQNCDSTISNLQSPPPPPLFNRSKLVQSLDLTAVILSTYTIDPEWCKQEFPDLFPSPTCTFSLVDESTGTEGEYCKLEENQNIKSKNIPTLVLHGHKGLNASKGTSSTTSSFTKSKRRFNQHPKMVDYLKKFHSDNDDNQVDSKQQNHSNLSEMASKFSRKLYKEPIYNNHNHDDDSEYDTDASEYGAMNEEINESLFKTTDRKENKCHDTSCSQQDNPHINEQHNSPLFGPFAFLTEILSSWIPPQDLCHGENTLNTLSNNQQNSKPNPDETNTNHDDDNIGVDNYILSKRKSCKGVHHPKYMILFEKQGSIVVIVSTSNLTRPSSVEASWVQRFEPRTHNVRKNRNDSQQSNVRDCSDFGHVLCDFIKRQSHAAKKGQILPLQFLQKYAGFPNLQSLDDLCYMYNFEEAQVHLVSTVPGKYDCRVQSVGNNNNISKPRILYGPQRVADILRHLQEDPNSTDTLCDPWLPHHFLSNVDRLVIQMTSLGGQWKSKNLDELARLYLGIKSDDTNNQSDTDPINRLDIIWPTQDFMNSVNQNFKDAQNAYLSPTRKYENDADHFLFLSTKTFNELDLACLSRMTVYEPSNPCPMPYTLPPHIKTISRVLCKDLSSISNQGTRENDHDNFGFMMLTSACLSRGAQGVITKDPDFLDEVMAYSNFELGVLFCSRLQGSNSDRLYRSYSPKLFHCCKHRPKLSGRYSSTNDYEMRGRFRVGSKEYCPRVIPLPIPFKSQSAPYQRDPDDAHFSVDPFFHEVVPNTEASGMLALTPFGKMVTKRLMSDSSQYTL